MAIWNFAYAEPLTVLLGTFLADEYVVHEEVGRGAFIAIFLTSAMTGGLFSLTRYVWIGALDVTSLGASCAVAGLTAAWAWLPTRRE